MANGTKLVSLDSLKKLHDYYLLHFAKEVTPELFGAVGDGVTDDTKAFRAAIDYLAANGQGTLRLKNRRYWLKNLEITESLQIIGDKETVLTGPGGYPLMDIDYRSSLRADVKEITSDGILTTLTVDKLPADVKRGSIIKIYANGPLDMVPNIRYNSFIGEFLTVFDVNRETRQISVYQSLRYDYVPSRGHTRVMFVSNKSITLSNFSVEITEPSDTINNVGAIQITAGARHSISDITVIEAPECVFRMNGCYGYCIERVNALYQRDTHVFEDMVNDVMQLGYTISDNGGGYFRVSNCQCNNIRHFFDTGTADTWQEKRDSTGEVICHGGEISGVSEYGAVSNIVSQGASAMAMSTHENTYQVTFDNIITNGNAGTGVVLRGDQVIFQNSFVAANGIGLFMNNFPEESGTPTKNPGNHLIQNCTFRVPSGYAMMSESDFPLNAVFKNCTFYGAILLKAPNSTYEFYNCQFFNSGTEEEDAIHIEREDVCANFYDCDIKLRISPRLGKELNFVNCTISNTYNGFYGGWTDYILNFKHCTLEHEHEMFFDFRSDNQSNVLFQDCVLKRVYFDVDLTGEEIYIEKAHKRFKLLNSLVYPSRTSIFGVRCSVEIIGSNITVVHQQDYSSWSSSLVAKYPSEKGFPADQTEVRVEINGVTFTKDFMNFYTNRGVVLKCEDGIGTLLGYIQNLTGSDRYISDIYFLESPENVTENKIVAGVKAPNVYYDQADYDKSHPAEEEDTPIPDELLEGELLPNGDG